MLFQVISEPIFVDIAPDTEMKVWVNGQEAGTFTIEKRGFFFGTANIYMNPLVVFLGAFIIGCLFVIMGAAGGLFTAAFQCFQSLLQTGQDIGLRQVQAAGGYGHEVYLVFFPIRPLQVVG